MELLKKKSITRTLLKERKGHYIKKSIMKERNMNEQKHERVRSGKSTT